MVAPLEEAEFKIGGSTVPLTLTGHTLLEDCDPVIFNCLDFFAFVLDQYFLTRLSAEFTSAGVKIDAVTNPITSVVAEKISYDPTPFLQENQYKLPLLAMYRTNEDYSEHTREYFKADSEIKILYALPPLNAAQYNRINPILVRMARAIMDRVEKGWDPNYNDGETVFATADLMQFVVKSTSFGSIQKVNSNMFYPAFEMVMTVSDRRERIAGAYDDLAGIDTTLQVSENDTVIDFIEFVNEFP